MLYVKDMANGGPRAPGAARARRLGREEIQVLREQLRDWDLKDIITVLGEGDVLEVIGVERQLEYIQSVGFGSVGEGKRLVRERVAELAYSFKCDDTLESLVDATHMSAEEQLDRRERAWNINRALGRR
jgi:hypothetical protein